MNPILAAESIGKSFGRRTVLTAAGVWAMPGRTSVVLGRNGCGKTTLLRIACGLLRPDYGVVIFRGERLLRPKLWKMARQGLFFYPNVPCCTAASAAPSTSTPSPDSTVAIR